MDNHSNNNHSYKIKTRISVLRFSYNITYVPKTLLEIFNSLIESSSYIYMGIMNNLNHLSFLLL